jgi:acetylornithine/LysW-gamma-L-lysine aminotransferase
MSSFKTGDHTSTFGGNPLACKSATAAIDVLIEEKLADLAAVNGKYLMKKLEGLKDKYNIIREVRGLGLMIGIEMRFDVLDIILQSQKRGVILLDAGRNILRLLPPLVIKQKQLDRVVQVLDQTLREK